MKSKLSFQQSITAGAIAGGVAAVINAVLFFIFHGFGIFRIVAIILLVLSLVSPFTQIPNVTTGFGVVLDIMHVVVAMSVLYFINRSVQAAK